MSNLKIYRSMKITNADLRGIFIPHLRELSTIPTSTKVAYNAAKTIKSALGSSEAYDTARKTILDTSASKDDKGTPKTGLETIVDAAGNPIMENGKPKQEMSYLFDTPEIKADCLKKLRELELMEIELDVFPVSLNDFGSSQITAQMILALKDFITE